MDLEVMDIPDSISDHYSPSITRHGNCHGCIFQRHHGSADLLLKIPEPERAVARGGEDVSAVGGYRQGGHFVIVSGESKAKLAI